MRKLFAALTLAALAAACSDEPTRPSSDGPQLARQASAHGGWVVRYSADDNWCGFWDADNNFLPPVPCQWVYTPGPNGNFNMRIWSTEPVPNPTGRAYHSGPTNYPQLLADWYLEVYGVTPVNGMMPLCDFNALQDPTYSSLMCTTNWHYTISASGRAMFVATFDPGHTP